MLTRTKPENHDTQIIVFFNANFYRSVWAMSEEVPEEIQEETRCHRMMVPSSTFSGNFESHTVLH